MITDIYLKQELLIQNWITLLSKIRIYDLNLDGFGKSDYYQQRFYYSELIGELCCTNDLGDCA
jgi:hypothetical protein